MQSLGLRPEAHVGQSYPWVAHRGAGHGGRGEAGKDGQEGSRAWRGPNVMRRKDHSGLEENGLCAEEDRETRNPNPNPTITLTSPNTNANHHYPPE